jgi:hypothetical protein
LAWHFRFTFEVRSRHLNVADSMAVALPARRCSGEENWPWLMWQIFALHPFLRSFWPAPSVSPRHIPLLIKKFQDLQLCS